MSKDKGEPSGKQQFCIVVVPTYGEVEIQRYEDHGEGMRALHDIHKLKFTNHFQGDIISFIGDFVKVSNMIPTIQIEDPVRGKLELRDDTGFGEPEA